MYWFETENMAVIKISLTSLFIKSTQTQPKNHLYISKPNKNVIPRKDTKTVHLGQINVVCLFPDDKLSEIKKTLTLTTSLAQNSKLYGK